MTDEYVRRDIALLFLRNQIKVIMKIPFAGAYMMTPHLANAECLFGKDVTITTALQTKPNLPKLHTRRYTAAIFTSNVCQLKARRLECNYSEVPRKECSRGDYCGSRFAAFLALLEETEKLMTAKMDCATQAAASL